jgi:hypothetical protein
VVLGVGVLLLLVLIVALFIVLLRGRGGRQDEYVSDTFEPYAPTPGGWPVDSGDTSTPITQGPTEAGPGVVTSDWEEPTPPPPIAPAPVAPAEPGIPQAGETVVIQRAPKHLGMLVDKARPDRKYDLKGTVNIGRGRDNQIVLDDPTVSRHHAWIKAEGEDFLVFDVGSANKTYVNGELVEEPRQLENGDVVAFGDAELVFTKVF